MFEIQRLTTGEQVAQLDPEQFATWLEDRVSKGLPAGNTCSHYACPIAQWVHEQYNIVVSLGVDDLYVGRFSRLLLPSWAGRFVQAVDGECHQRREVSAVDALAVLRSV